MNERQLDALIAYLDIRDEPPLEAQTGGGHVDRVIWYEHINAAEQDLRATLED